nr:hypothetical protein [Peptoniphilus lacrimalis]
MHKNPSDKSNLITTGSFYCPFRVFLVN